MKCPTCLSIMKCISAINTVPGQPGKNRMDLHCYNREDPRSPNTCRARCHVSVITEDPKEWICHEYNLSFSYEENLYYLIGYDKLVDPYFQGRSVEESHTILSDVFGREMVKTNFIPISTGDDMHLEAEKLFHRMRKLVIFS
jgi:hypothetical protein